MQLVILHYHSFFLLGEEILSFSHWYSINLGLNELHIHVFWTFQIFDHIDYNYGVVMMTVHVNKLFKSTLKC